MVPCELMSAMQRQTEREDGKMIMVTVKSIARLIIIGAVATILVGGVTANGLELTSATAAAASIASGPADNTPWG